MSNIIKSSGALGVMHRLGVEVKPVDLTQHFEAYFDGEEHSKTAQKDCLEKAQQEADIIVRSAKSEAQSIHDEAYSDGYRTGLQDAAPVINDLVSKLESEIASVEEDKAAVIDTIEPDVLKLCLDIVEKIIRHEVKTNKRVILRVVKSCLRRLRNVDEVTVRVSPQEVEEVRAKRDELLKAAEGIKGLNIIDDRRVSPGGCLVESPSGELDMKVETQLEQVSNKVMEIYENDRRQTNTELNEIPASDQQT